MYYLYVFQIGAFLHEGKIAGENGVCRSVPVIHASVAGCQLQTEIICIQRGGRLALQYAAQNIRVFSKRESQNLIFFLSPTEDPQKPYICLQMQVNGWIIRINDAELDK